MYWIKSYLFVFLLSVFSATASAQSSSEIDISGWKAYRNETIGFEVKHPSTWLINVSSGSVTLMGKTTFTESVEIKDPLKVDDRAWSYSFHIHRKINPDGLSINEWNNGFLRMFNMPQLLYTTTFIDGQPTLRVEESKSAAKVITFSFKTVLNRTDIFKVSINHPANQTQLHPIYSKILSTIKFIQQPVIK